MSNLQFSPETSQVLAKDWRALADIGKSFRALYLLMYYTLLGGLIAIPVVFLWFLLCGIIAQFSEDYAVIPIFLFFIAYFLCLVGLVVYYLKVLYAMFIRIWHTPENLVPGGKIIRTACGFAIAGIVLFPLIILFHFISAILSFIYMYRLANAIDSQRVKDCLKWTIIWCVAATIMFIIMDLVFVSTIDVSQLEADQSPTFTTLQSIIMATLLALTFIFQIIGGVFGLLTFRNMGKDIEAFVDSHIQKKNDSSNQPDFQSLFPQENQQVILPDFQEDNSAEPPQKIPDGVTE